MSNYLGIDIGKDGGISVVDENSKILHKCVMPVIAGEDLDVILIEDILIKYKPKHCVLEKLHGMAHWGVKTNFELGGQYHLVKGILTLNSVPFTAVIPKMWQKEMFEGIRVIEKNDKIDTKAMAEVAVKRLFPTEDFRKSDRSKNTHNGIIDAVLMASFCSRKFR